MRDIVIWPDPILRVPVEPVTKFDEYLHDLIEDMFRIMKKFGGVGLSAPQVGKRLAVIVYKCDGEEGILVNPVLTPTPDAKITEMGEGCLSFPGVYVNVKRPELFDLKWQDEDGKEEEDEFYELLAVAVQHELDHLEGITIADHLSHLKRDIVTRKMKKIKKKREKMIHKLRESGQLDDDEA